MLHFWRNISSQIKNIFKSRIFDHKLNYLHVFLNLRINLILIEILDNQEIKEVLKEQFAIAELEVKKEKKKC